MKETDKMGDEIPMAEVHLKKCSDGVQLWVIAECPLCGNRHIHGAGPVGEDPQRYLGHRVGHCLSRDVGRGCVLVELGYVLVERGGK
jgi:hypothetical protein